jgi:hypothetical protein
MLARGARAAPSNSLPDLNLNTNSSGAKSTEAPVRSTDKSIYHGVTSTSRPDFSFDRSKRAKVLFLYANVFFCTDFTFFLKLLNSDILWWFPNGKSGYHSDAAN